MAVVNKTESESEEDEGILTRVFGIFRSGGSDDDEETSTASTSSADALKAEMEKELEKVYRMSFLLWQ